MKVAQVHLAGGSKIKSVKIKDVRTVIPRPTGVIEIDTDHLQTFYFPNQAVLFVKECYE